MSYMLIAELVVVGVPLGCVVVWTMRAVMPARAKGQSARWHDRQWFLGLFRQGFAMVRRCSWVILIPVAAELASLNLQLGYWYAVTRTASPPPGGIPRVNTGALARILRDLPTALPFSLLRAAKDMTAVLLCGGSWPVMFLGAAVAGLFLLRPVTASSEVGPGGPPRRRNAHFRAGAGFLCLCVASAMGSVIVLQPSSLPGGLSQCARLWARHWRNAAVLVGIGALLLLVPVICTRYLHWLLPRPAGIGLVLRILASLLRIALSALISCSMMAFCKAVLEEEAEARPVPEIPVDVPTQNGKNGSALI